MSDTTPPLMTDEQIDRLIPSPDGTAEVNVTEVEVLPGVMGTEFDVADAWSRPLVVKACRAVAAPLLAEIERLTAERAEWEGRAVFAENDAASMRLLVERLTAELAEARRALALVQQHHATAWNRGHTMGMAANRDIARQAQEAVARDAWDNTRLTEALLAAEAERDEARVALKAARVDAERLDHIEKYARCDPKMDGQHVWWPTVFNHRLIGPTLRAAIDTARESTNG